MAGHNADSVVDLCTDSDDDIQAVSATAPAGLLRNAGLTQQDSVHTRIHNLSVNRRTVTDVEGYAAAVTASSQLSVQSTSQSCVSVTHNLTSSSTTAAQLNDVKADTNTNTEHTLQDLFECQICLEPIAVSASLECGHTYCITCVDDWSQRPEPAAQNGAPKPEASATMDCPTCGSAVRRGALTRYTLTYCTT